MKITAYKDHKTNMWLLEYTDCENNRIQAMSTSLVTAMCILFRMRTGK